MNMLRCINVIFFPILKSGMLLFATTGFSQVKDSDSVVCSKFFTKALGSNWVHGKLEVLTKYYPSRLCGTQASLGALDWSEKCLIEAGADTVFRQSLLVPSWIRGNPEKAEIITGKKSERVTVCTLGNSIGTGKQGITAGVVEVKSLEELASLGKEKVKGKIVFFNLPMDPSHYNTFMAYGGAAWQRTRGAKEAAKYGATAVVVRSLTLATDTFPHTGVMRYDTAIVKIPAFCISTLHADTLSARLRSEPDARLFLYSDCLTLPDTTSYNVIAELKGSIYPEKYITIGGHIDCWDNGPGAHDDGAGIAHTIEALRLFKETGIRPRHTLRFVMFMDEEIDQRGAKKYFELAKTKNEIHVAAIESDAGGTTPIGFSADAPDSVFTKLIEWSTHFKRYGMYQYIRGWSGVDIGPLKKLGTSLFGLMPDSQRYFDYHHSGNDTFNQVNKRELQLGSAAIAFLAYQLDKYYE